MTQVSRFLEYRRALWLTDTNNAEEVMRNALARLPQSVDRVVQRADGSAVMATEVLDEGINGLFLKCVKYTPQEGVGVVSMTPATAASVSSQLPGNDRNFTTSDFYALLYRDNFITLNAGIGAAMLRMFLHGIVEAAGLPSTAAQFDIVRIASARELQRIDAAGGVARVELDLTLEDAAREAVNAAALQQRRSRSVFAQTRDHLVQLAQDYFTRPDAASGLSASTKGKVRLSINVPAGDINRAKSGIDSLAAGFVADDEADDYKIELRNGDTIKPSEIAVKKRIRVRKQANLINSDDARVEILQFLQELRTTGQLEA